jgi:hypothetical protein
MARPRVFISSTYYDLKQTRENLDQFLTSLGYDTVRNEHGDIPYGNQDALEKYCYKEVGNIDIFVSIIGGRFGSESKESEWSISNEELRTAFNKGKQVYIFIEKSVDNEYGTYLLNKGNADTKYKYVDNVKIYQFLEEIHKLTTNNNIKTFESSSEIQDYLKEQFAGLFQSFLESSSKAKDVNLTNKLESLAERFEQLSQKLEKTNDAVEETISANQFISHPVVQRIASFMELRYGIWFDDYAKLNGLFGAYGWKPDDGDDAYRWTHETSIAGSVDVISVNKSLFDENGKLLPFNSNVAYDDAVRLMSEVTTEFEDDDLPF